MQDFETQGTVLLYVRLPGEDDYYHRAWIIMISSRSMFIIIVYS